MIVGKITLTEKGIRLYESKHTSGEQVKEHHHDIYQVLYALDGEGAIKLNGEEMTFKQNNVAVIVPYSSHSIVSSSRLTVLVLAFDENILSGSIQEDLLHNFFSSTQLVELSPFEGSNVRELLRKMLYEQSYGDSINVVALKVYLAELLLKFARSQQHQETFDANTLRAERLRTYIDSHYFENINAQDLSSKLGVTPRHLNTIFKEKYQVTPIQYLSKIRVDLAKKLLVETENDIASICFETGFESLSTFYRTFKNVTEISPKKYRNAYKK